ncbi:Alpha-(1,3)-fucosyltransferase 7 [Blomia tropicalis]|nr:Alpha-(1,3)-fucosyltransferase 7 [Blomia tropicalis]
MFAMIRLKFRRTILYILILLVGCLVIANILVRIEKTTPPKLHWTSNLSQTMKKYNNNNNNANVDNPYVPIRFVELISPEFDELGNIGHYQLEWSLKSLQTNHTKPWFMSNGSIRPSPKFASRLAIWPEEVDSKSLDSNNDRIVNQLMYVPETYDGDNFLPKGKLPLKKILLYFGKRGWGDIMLGRNQFLNDRCPVDACTITDKANMIKDVDAVIFKDRFMWPKEGRQRMNQLWILFLLEGPMYTQLFNSMAPNVINWTATYRHDSDIVTPYEKYVSYDSLSSSSFGFIFRDKKHSYSIIHNGSNVKNYAMGKTRKVAWFVSNCNARNKRIEYARELSKYIEVDIFGSCGLLKCPRSKNQECFASLNRDYKFYLAFENSNCRDYITEKFFVNGLGRNSDDLNVLPIVMGGHPNDYRRSAPPNSYIHVDDFRSPAHLASYLKHLDKNDYAYNQYFEWKRRPRKGEFINTYFWCRLCALLHAPLRRSKPSVSYKSMAQWWAPKNVCTYGLQRWHLNG